MIQTYMHDYDRGSILVVDDDPDIVDLLREVLEINDYRVETAVGAGALSLARDARPDLILLDLHMPGMDGVEVSRRLRADPATSSISIIALSAAHDLRERAAEMAADDYLDKPFELSKLLACVDRWASRSLITPLRAVGGGRAAAG